MAQFYTLGEVSQITEIDKRTLKYYVERKIITPSNKKVEGGKESWLYSKSDIGKIRQIALYRELGYSADDIRNMIQAPGFDWSENLYARIGDLKRKKRHLENVIFAAEFMKYASEKEHTWSEFDISYFDNDIDRFANNIFTSDEEKITEQGTEKIYADLTKEMNAIDIQEQWKKLFAIIESVREAMDYEPDSEKAQQGLSQLFCWISEMASNKEEQSGVLMALRIVANLSIDRVIDMFVGKPGSTDFIAKAFEIHCKRDKKKCESVTDEISKEVLSVRK